MKGILFKPWRSKAIRENPDREWQTRQLGGLKEINQEPDEWFITGFDDEVWGFEKLAPDPEEFHRNIKPHYRVGEVVYIKEAWADLWQSSRPPDVKVEKWRSPLFMPAWAARYFIQITDVKAERLQEITEEDAIKEGVILKAVNVIGDIVDEPSYRTSFAMLWDSINPKYPFSSNPWDFVYGFKKVDHAILSQER